MNVTIKKNTFQQNLNSAKHMVPANVDIVIHMLDRYLLVCIHFAPTYQLPNQLPDEYTICFVI